MSRLAVVTVTAVVATAAVVAFAPAASAQGSPTPPLTPSAGAWSSLGTTTVTTAPGIATTLLRAGIAR